MFLAAKTKSELCGTDMNAVPAGRRVDFVDVSD
jgi:hypothetical protein